MCDDRRCTLPFSNWAVNHKIIPVSKLFRNVPFLTSLEVSPFPVLLLSGSLALPGAQPCGARRAERLGRSAGQGQRRARRGRRLSGRFLLCPATGRLPPRVIRRRHPLPLGPRQTRRGGPLERRLHRAHTRLGGCRDLLPPQRAALVLDGDSAVLPFAHQHFALRWCVVATLRLQLEKPVVVSHHPVLTDRAFALQPESPIQFRGPRRTTVIVLWPGWRPGKSSVVFGQILPLQIHVGVFVTADFLPPQFFHQPVLVCPVNPLHAPLGLRRVRRNHCDPQLRTHAPKLRDRLFSAQPLFRRGRALVQVLPIHVQRQRHPVALDPRAQRIGHRPDRLLLAQSRPRRVGSVIDQVDQATLRTALLQPVVKTAVHLHHLPKVLLALAPSPVPPPLPLATPQPFRQHPASQRFGIHLQPILRCQVLRRQRRPEALTDRPTVLLAHQPQHLLPKLLLVSTIRWLSRAAVLQTRGAFLPIPLPQPLGLPAAHAHQPRRIHHPQLLAAHSRQHFYSSQLPLAHLRPPQSDLLSEVLLGGHFYRGQKGTLSSRRNRGECCESLSGESCL